MTRSERVRRRILLRERFARLGFLKSQPSPHVRFSKANISSIHTTLLHYNLKTIYSSYFPGELLRILYLKESVLPKLNFPTPTNEAAMPAKSDSARGQVGFPSL